MLQQITVYFGPQSYNVNSGNIEKFIKASKNYNSDNTYHSDLYYLGVNKDGKIREKTLSDAKKALGEIEDEKCLELLEEISKFVPKKAEDVKVSVRRNPIEKAAAAADLAKELMAKGYTRDQAEKMAKAAV
jgi:hypothetical protein